jgi:hypothetical protein
MFTFGEKISVFYNIMSAYHYHTTITVDGEIIIKSEYDDVFPDLVTKYENIDKALIDWVHTLECNNQDNEDDYWNYEIAFIKKLMQK